MIPLRRIVRVNGALTEDGRVRRFAISLMPDRRPHEATAAVVGMITTLWGHFSEALPDGVVTGCDDDQLEAWAGWWGTPGAFAAWYRSAFAPMGVAEGWEECNGTELRRLSKDAARKRRARRTPPSERVRAGEPELALGGTPAGADAPPKGKGGTKPTKPEPKRPPSDTVIRTEHGEVTMPAAGIALLERFYGANPQRMGEAARFLILTLQLGAPWTEPGRDALLVRAVDKEHLTNCCQAVMDEPPESDEAAIPHVAQLLLTSYDTVKQQRTSAKAAETRAEKEERLAAAQNYVDGVGGLWDLLESEVDELLPADQRGRPSPSRNLLLETAVLDAFERRRTMEDGRRKQPRPTPAPVQTARRRAGEPEPPVHTATPVSEDAEIPAELLRDD